MADEIKPLSEATDIEDFKRLRAEHREGTAEPAEKVTQAEEATPVIAAEPGTAETKVQEPVEKSAEDRIKELRSKGRHAAANELMVKTAVEAEKARADKLDEELKALRAPKFEPARVAAAAAPQPAAAEKPAESDPEPKATDEAYGGADGYNKYLRDVTRWDTRQEIRRADAGRQQEAQNVGVRESLNRKMTDARAKYSDFDTVTAGDMTTGQGLILSPVMIDYAKNRDRGLDVVYALGKNPADYQRIFMLPANQQPYELAMIEARLSGTPAAVAAPPVVLKPAVSRVAPAPRVLSGNDTPEPKGTSEASTFEDFKRIRRSARAS